MLDLLSTDGILDIQLNFLWLGMELGVLGFTTHILHQPLMLDLHG